MTIKERVTEKVNNMVEKVSYNTQVGSFARDIISTTAIELVKEEDDFESRIDSHSIFEATGTDLDTQCADNAIKRKTATFARGQVRVEGINGTIIKKGYKVINSVTNVEYEILEEKTINNFSTIVDIQALTTGTDGNADIGVINKFVESYTGLTNVINEQQISNGKNIETDEELRERALNLIQKPRISWNAYVFEDKAKEIDGVDNAKCIPRPRGKGSVDIIITQKNRDVVDEKLKQQVLEYIDFEIISDINIKVIGAVGDTLTVAVVGELSSDFDFESAGIKLKDLINKYLFKQIFKDRISYFDLIEIIQHSGTFNHLENVLLDGKQQDYIADVTKLYKVEEISIKDTK